MSSLPALEESKILVPVDVTREDGIALRLGQTVQMHLLVEEVDHLLQKKSPPNYFLEEKMRKIIAWEEPQKFLFLFSPTTASIYF